MLAVPPSPVEASIVAPASGSTQRDPSTGPHAREDAAHAGLKLDLTPAHGSMAPRALQPRVTSNTQLVREVFGFAPYWALGQNANWNYSLLSTVAYFGLTVNGDGNFSTTDQGWTGWNSQNLVDTFNRAHQSGDRAVVVIKAFNNATINAIVSSPAARQTLINNTIDAIAQRGLDGRRLLQHRRAGAKRGRVLHHGLRHGVGQHVGPRGSQRAALWLDL
ncbi:MAG: hypothetical protein AUI15_21655 [Actinobacteria bacterium 13_2_20CM_2_66_6]|nr:MAG: hypothetical protein AUI15_21655 [Actinobacteria bacterium 13_2_20CM_2_66_6]